MITRAEAGMLLLGLNEQGRSVPGAFRATFLRDDRFFPTRVRISCAGIMRSLKARRMPPNVLQALSAKANNDSVFHLF
jgi:hypothetical protein